STPSPVRGDAAAIGESFETIPDRKIVCGSDGITEHHLSDLSTCHIRQEAPVELSDLSVTPAGTLPR
ncbi:hypothetical protein, partial [Streptococcus suis]|uniref:hypothetical protein n=1 Tax=Streptococcus suis TaxID=1307 RepID=UPI001C671280